MIPCGSTAIHPTVSIAAATAARVEHPRALDHALARHVERDAEAVAVVLDRVVQHLAEPLAVALAPRPGYQRSSAATRPSGDAEPWPSDRRRASTSATGKNTVHATISQIRETDQDRRVKADGSPNPRIPGFLRAVTWVECAVVAGAAALLFALPERGEQHVWAWQTPPFTARYVGSIFIAAPVPLVILAMAVLEDARPRAGVV